MSISRGPEIDFERLYQIAEERDEVELLENNIFNLYQINRRDSKIQNIFDHKRKTTDQKIEEFKAYFGYGATASKLFFELLYLMLELKITHKIYYIFEGFSKIIEERKNRVIVQVSTAVPITIDVLPELKTSLERVLQKKVLLKNSIDPTLLGGMMIKLRNGKIFDFTYKRELSDLKYYLMEKTTWKN